jgi:mercuric ion transport protein
MGMGQDTQPPQRGLGALFAGGGALAGLATLLGASCCVLPLLLAQIGLGTALAAQLSFLEQAKPYLLAATLALIAASLVASFWGGRRPRPIVLALMLGAAALVVGAEILPHYEGQIMRWIGHP